MRISVKEILGKSLEIWFEISSLLLRISAVKYIGIWWEVDFKDRISLAIVTAVFLRVLDLPAPPSPVRIILSTSFISVSMLSASLGSGLLGCVVVLVGI